MSNAHLAVSCMLFALSITCTYVIQHHPNVAPYVVTLALVVATVGGELHMLLAPVEDN